MREVFGELEWGSEEARSGRLPTNLRALALPVDVNGQRQRRDSSQASISLAHQPTAPRGETPKRTGRGKVGSNRGERGSCSSYSFALEMPKKAENCFARTMLRADGAREEKGLDP